MRQACRNHLISSKGARTSVETGKGSNSKHRKFYCSSAEQSRWNKIIDSWLPNSRLDYSEKKKPKEIKPAFRYKHTFSTAKWTFEMPNGDKAQIPLSILPLANSTRHTPCSALTTCTMKLATLRHVLYSSLQTTNSFWFSHFPVFIQKSPSF